MSFFASGDRVKRTKENKDHFKMKSAFGAVLRCPAPSVINGNVCFLEIDFSLSLGALFWWTIDFKFFYYIYLFIGRDTCEGQKTICGRHPLPWPHGIASKVPSLSEPFASPTPTLKPLSPAPKTLGRQSRPRNQTHWSESLEALQKSTGGSGRREVKPQMMGPGHGHCSSETEFTSLPDSAHPLPFGSNSSKHGWRGNALKKVN